MNSVGRRKNKLNAELQNTVHATSPEVWLLI